MESRMYLHVDLDAFFASVEILDNPALKGKPLIVGGLPGERRSVVSTCSYEARKYGIHSAMPISRAYELCPQAIFLHGRMERYHEKSLEVMSVFREFSPDVMQMSVDEAFIDITGTEMLFGPPETLARELKKRVHEKTGLTVSVGIASNRYVAKIASGLKKPDGLCYVPEGDEEKFMLSLPLDKLWGIGSKSRERLNGCGIFTIPEIHAVSESALKELFGEASGSFLYRSVRGMDVEHFGDETKSRSLSSEKTYCFDLSDIYAIETELLHLSYDVMFRVLREQVKSRTVCLKIRYEDFSTVTVTESSPRIVSSIEDLFERSCRLFHKKYERGRGIRLLGLGLQNIDEGLESDQGELFDFGEKKQRSVEKTVLKLHQKNPSTKLRKARQLITPLIALFFFLSSPLPIHAESDETGELETSHADPFSVYTDVIEFEVEGSWESVFSGTTTVYFGEEAPSLSMQSPVFTQKANALVWFLYDNHWYFDASVDTESEINKIAAGYLGDGIIKEIRVGTDIGTEDMSPGIKLSLEGSSWSADASVHLDAIQMHSKTWNGSNELISENISLSSFKKGMLFSTINSSVASQITALYVEDASGEYKRLSQNQYLILPAKGLIYLATPAAGGIIAEIADRSIVESELPSFLTDVSDWFGDRGAESTYTMMGLTCSDEDSGPSISETSPFFTTIPSATSASSQGLYLLKPGYFSPFQVCSLYDNSTQSASLSITVNAVSLYAGQSSPILLNDASSLIQLHSNESNEPDNYAEASVRFPAGKKFPEIYLPSNGITESTVPCITTTTSHASDSFSIGTKAIENSIRVQKNGVFIPHTYDKTTGNVSLSVPYSSSDTIYITWNEYSEESEDMSLSMAASFKANPTESLTTSGSLESMLFLDSETHTFSKDTEAPYISASLDGSWERTFGNVTITAANALSINGTIGISGAKTPVLSFSGDGNEAVWFLEGTDDVDSIPPLTARTASQAVPVLTNETKQSGFTVESISSEQSSGQTITIQGTLPRNNGGNPSWYACTIPLSAGAATLPSARQFSFFLKDLKKSSSTYDVYLKLGEVTWLISSSSQASAGTDVISPFILCSDSSAPVKVLLNDSDRQKLSVSDEMILVIVNKSDTTDSDIKLELKGYENALSGISFNVSAENSSGISTKLPVIVSETSFPAEYTEEGWFSDSNTESKAACISWNTTEASYGTTISVERCIAGVSLSRFTSATFIVFVPEESEATEIEINLLKTTDSGYETVTSLTLTEAEIAAHKGEWYTVTDSIVSDATITKVQININARPDTDCPNEKIYIGGIFLTDPVSSFTGNDTASASIAYETDTFKASLYTDVTGSGTYTEQIGDTDLVSAVRASIVTPVITIKGNGTFDIQQSKLLSGDYALSTTDGFLSDGIVFSEDYRISAKSDEESRKDALTLSLIPLHIPLSLQGSVETSRSETLMNGKNAFCLSSEYAAGKTVLSFTTEQTNADQSAFSYLGTSDAEKRKESGTFTQNLSFASGSVTPSLEAGFSAVSERDKVEKSGSFSQKLSVPFSINSNTITFEYKRETSAGYIPENTPCSFTDDILLWTDSFSIHKDALSIIPVFDLFSDTISDTLEQSLENASFASRSTYTSSSSLSWFRPIRADRLDLILPNSASVSAERTLSQAGLNTLDEKKFSIALTFTAFNCLGATAAKPVFTWYEQDELQYTAKVTFESEVRKTQLTGYGTLYFSEDASFTTSYTGEFSDDDSCGQTIQFLWKRPAELFKKEAERITSGTVGIEKESSEEDSEYNIDVSHKAVVTINENFSINGEANIKAIIEDDTSLDITFSIGAKYQF